MISDLGNDVLICNYNWQLRKSIALWLCSRYTDAQTEHGHSADRVRMFRVHSTNILWLAARQFTGIRQICISYLCLYCIRKLLLCDDMLD